MPAPCTILIVDDETVGRTVLTAMLDQIDCLVQVAVDGSDALAKAKAHTPDLVLLDVMMPDLDGYQVCEHMRQDPQLADIPIIMVTALDDRESRLRGLQAGADDFISKPFDWADLQARVTNILRLNRHRRIQTERTKFDWVVEQAVHGYLILDESDHIRYMNAQARLFVGADSLSSSDPTLTFSQLVRRQYAQEPASAWANWPKIETDDAGSVERFLVRADSATSQAFWLAVEAIPLPQDSQNGMLVRLRNITAQMGLARDQRIFHALVQHRLRTPVTLMQGSLDIIAHELEGNADLSELVQVLQGGTHRIYQDVEEILAYLKAPTLQTMNRGVGLTALPGLVDLCAHRLKLSPIPTTLPSLPDDNLGQTESDVKIPMDARVLDLILLELLQNARKFHPTHSPTAHVTVTLDGEKRAHIFVRDDGIHLDPDQLTQVWRPYFQAEKGFSGQVDGWGLGLATVASLVWGVGGSCRLGNRADRPGVEVELILPTST